MELSLGQQSNEVVGSEIMKGQGVEITLEESLANGSHGTDASMTMDHNYVHNSFLPGNKVESQENPLKDFKVYRCGECNDFFVNISTLLAHMELHILSAVDGKQLMTSETYLPEENCEDVCPVKQEVCQLTSFDQGEHAHQNDIDLRGTEGHCIEVIHLSSIQKLNSEYLADIAKDESVNFESDSKLPEKRRRGSRLRNGPINSISMLEESLPEKTVLLKNENTDEDEPPYRCGICGKQLASSRSRDRHVGLHSGEKPHSCNICDKKFANPYDLKKHSRVHTGEKPYECDICKRRFAQSSTMTIHRQTHDRRTPSLCSICGNQFSSIKSLRLHVKLHSEETSFECMYCRKRFGQIGRLKRHMRNHTGERPYVCETCGKSFLTPRAFQAHNSVHTGERPYRCSYCPKAFADAGILRKHKRIHTGEKPYKCETCSKDFGQAESLRIHRRTHTGERPYKCTDCDKCFQSLSNLKTHTRTHTKDKPFSCTQCGVTYSTNGQLVKHTQKVHQSASDSPTQSQSISYSALLDDKLCGWS